MNSKFRGVIIILILAASSKFMHASESNLERNKTVCGL